MNQRISALSFGYAGAATSALGMLILGVLGSFGVYTGAVYMMNQWHMFFSLSPLGIIMGMIEAAIIGFIFTYLFGLFYNKFLS